MKLRSPTFRVKLSQLYPMGESASKGSRHWVVVQFRKRGSALLGARAPSPALSAQREDSFHQIYLAFENHRLWRGRARAPAFPVASGPTPKLNQYPLTLSPSPHEAGNQPARACSFCWASRSCLPQIAPGDDAEFVIDQGQQCVGRPIALAAGYQHLG